MKAQSTSKGFAALSIANIVVKLLSLLYVPVLMGILTRPGHGKYAFAYEIFVFAYIVLTEGFAKGVTKLVSEMESLKEESKILTTFKEALRIMFVLGSVASVLIFTFAPNFARLGESPDSYPAIRALAPALLTTSLVSVYRGYFQGRMYMKPYAYSQVIEHIFNVVLSIGFAYYFNTYFYSESYTYAVAGGAFGTTIASLISLLYLIYVYKTKDSSLKGVEEVKDSAGKKAIVNLLKTYSIPLTIGAFLQQFGNLVDVFNVKNRLVFSGLNKVSADAQYSMLSTYKTFIGVPIGLVVALTMAVLPALARHYAAKDFDKLQRDYDASMKVGMLFVVPASFGLSGAAFEITRTLYPDIASLEWMSAFVLFVGAIATILMSISLIQTVALQSTGYYKDSIKPLVLGVVVKILFNFILVGMPSIRIYGAVISTYIAYVVTIVYSEYIIKNKLKVNISFNDYLPKTITASFVMWIFLMAVHYATYWMNLSRFPSAIVLLLQILIGAIIYAILIIKNGALRKSDLDALSPKIANKIPNRIKKMMKD